MQRANQAFYACGQITQPLIRCFGRTVGRLTRSGRGWKLLFAPGNYRLDWLQHARKGLESA